MANDTGPEEGGTDGAGPWYSLGEQTKQAVRSGLSALGAEDGQPEAVAKLSRGERAALLERCDAYLQSFWRNCGQGERFSLLQGLEQTAEACRLPAGVGGALVQARLQVAAAALRGKARSRAACASLWTAFGALETAVRADAVAMEERQREDERERSEREVAENARATTTALVGLTKANEPLEAAQHVLGTVRGAFGWEYARYWTVLGASNLLGLALVSGELTERLLQTHGTVKLSEGTGCLGQAWQSGEVVVASLEEEPSSELRSQEWERAGVKTVLALPISMAQRVVGIMEFAVCRSLEISAARGNTLREVSLLVSSTFERLAQGAEMRDLVVSAQAVNRVVQTINAASTRADAVRGALDALRKAFDWDYGVYWAQASSSAGLVFVSDSGEVSDSLRRAMRTGHHAEGVGGPGRAWQTRDLVVVDEEAVASDDLRGPAAQQDGLSSGVCVPLAPRGRVVGVLELRSKQRAQLSRAEADALRNVSAALSAALERLEERDGFASSLDDFAGELMEVSRSLRTTTAEQASSAQELASAVGEVTATLSELRETSSEALRNAESVIARAESASQTSDSGRESVGHAIASMRVIREQVGEIAERILRLNEQTSQIGSIISLVNEISAQSKLLALNAAIEAARAGDYGRGFGVVASEIRSLAEQSKEATNQVRGILGEIQSGTNAAVVAAKEGTKRSESGMALANVSGEKIQELARSMEESSVAARLIANSARQQNAGIEQAAQALVSLSNATSITAAGLKQTEEVTGQLVTLAERMANIVQGIVLGTS